MRDFKRIHKSESDLILEELGYSLIDEYVEFISAAGLNKNRIIFDVATGTGRAVSILSRSGFNVVTGDSSLELISEARSRISESFLTRVTFIKLNLEKIPFAQSSFGNIVCMNTIHELDNPETCLNQLSRLRSPEGTFILADFNERGFDIMDRVHMVKSGKLHRRGSLSPEQLRNFVYDNFSDITEIKMKLNTGYIIRGRKKQNEI